MASAFTDITRPAVGSEQHRSAPESFVIPDLLSCLVLTWSEPRAELLEAVARDESWHAQVGDEVQEFLRSVFQLEVPLTIVDLPPRQAAGYESLRAAAAQTCSLNRSLMVVCGSESDSEEEQWARQLGVWAYLPGAVEASGLKLVFAEARAALAKTSAARVEMSGYR